MFINLIQPSQPNRFHLNCEFCLFADPHHLQLRSMLLSLMPGLPVIVVISGLPVLFAAAPAWLGSSLFSSFHQPTLAGTCKIFLSAVHLRPPRAHLGWYLQDIPPSCCLLQFPGTSWLEYSSPSGLPASLAAAPVWLGSSLSSPWLVPAGHPHLTVSLRSSPAHPGWCLRDIPISLCLSQASLSSLWLVSTGPPHITVSLRSHQLAPAGAYWAYSSPCSSGPHQLTLAGACYRRAPPAMGLVS